MTVSVDEEIEEKFRKEVERELGKKKGALSKAVDEAFEKWTKEKRQEEIAEKELNLMEEGFEMGKVKFEREELHER